jgi:hypothetical protein
VVLQTHGGIVYQERNVNGKIGAKYCVETSLVKRIKWQLRFMLEIISVSDQNAVEYFYGKLARCNNAAMSEQETIEWIAHGLHNVKFRDHLRHLNRYKKPSELFPDIRSSSN